MDIDLGLYGHTGAEIDLLRYPARRSGILLDIVRFDGFLDYIYTILLNRAPDPKGRRYYRDLSRAGLSRPAIVRRLLRSPEFRLTRSSVDNDSERRVRLAALRAYVLTNQWTRVPLLGQWIMYRRERRRRLDWLELNQHLLARKVEELRQEVKTARFGDGEPFGFVEHAQDDGLAAVIFRRAFDRAQREA